MRLPKRAPLRELLRCLPDFIRLGSYDPRIERLLRRHEERTRETLARITAADPRTMSDAEIWKTFRWWVEIAPEAIQAVFLMSGVLFREVCVSKACNARRIPLRAARLHAAGRRQAVGEHAAGDRSRRARRRRRATSRAAMKYLQRERRHVRRFPHRARRHVVPRALRSVPRSLRPSRPLRVRLGAAAAAREPGAGALRHPAAAAGTAAGSQGGGRAAGSRRGRRVARVRSAAHALAAVDAAAARARDAEAAEEAVRLARAGALGSDARSCATHAPTT